MSEFEYEIGDRVCLKETNESGEIIGRAQYEMYPNSYLIRYKAADGRQVTFWWDVDSIDEKCEG